MPEDRNNTPFDKFDTYINYLEAMGASKEYIDETIANLAKLKLLKGQQKDFVIDSLAIEEMIESNAGIFERLREEAKKN